MDDMYFSEKIDAQTYCNQKAHIERLIEDAALDPQERAAVCDTARDLVAQIRDSSTPGLMESFLGEYGLSTDEGIAMMCLAEALLRVPDAETIDALIEDKIAPSDWQSHLGRSTSSLVNASTWALLLTGHVLDDTAPGPIGHLRAAIKRLGEPVIRLAVAQAMKEMGRQFVLGESITSAMSRAETLEEQGYTYSYDMLGEAAITWADADRYHLAYSKAISAIASACTSGDVRSNPGISVKLSALHPRYERAQQESVMRDLVPRLRALATIAKSAGMGLNVDAEEAGRLSLSLEVISAVLAEPALAGWSGFGVVVQAYGPRAPNVIDALYEMAKTHDRQIMVRLVKGAYWDTEIKHAQVLGMDGFPVLTQKAATDVSYISNARRLLGMTDRIYPQFATHNAHSVAAILHMAKGQDYEFQRLHGMGETLHEIVRATYKSRCRIYAPVGAHRDLLAYLVRRLLENGANSSFVNQIVDKSVPEGVIAADPFEQLEKTQAQVPTGAQLYEPERRNSRGFDLEHLPTLREIDAARDQFCTHVWEASPLTEVAHSLNASIDVINPANPEDLVGRVTEATTEDVTVAVENARIFDAPAEERAAILNKAADLYETHFGELFALLAREAGKSIPDAVAELREAVDFLRYYATQFSDAPPAGRIACISPWNFPLAIFTGQIAGALAAGNTVLAKPAPQTPLVAFRATELLHQAGVPRSALQLLPGGAETGAALTADPRLSGVAFTGSTGTAQRINQSLADNAAPGTPFIAETGGLNAMIVDSTALPEQAVRSVVESAFQSAGQRCSALRCLYVQEDIAESFTQMLIGAMDTLTLGEPWHLRTDIGPVIDEAARASIAAHVEQARRENRLLHETEVPDIGTFFAPTLIAVGGIGDLLSEIFGPVLHIATFKAEDLDTVISDINASGYGLTFGLHTRIDSRVQHVSDRIMAGNVYVNRNQIGAIVGTQPFGGIGLSGTGPKAGGPDYLRRLEAPQVVERTAERWSSAAPLPDLSDVPGTYIGGESLPGPTGESNRLDYYQSAPILCAGPGAVAAAEQAVAIEKLGGRAIKACGEVEPGALTSGPEYGGVLWWGDYETAREMAKALAARAGPILPLITGKPDRAHVQTEHHLCVDTTASGGNTALLGAAM